MKNVGFSQALVLFALLLLLPVSGTWAAGGAELAVPAPVGVSPDALEINVWYGDTQDFGLLGNPQKQINILGNAQSANTLAYSLNGGAFQAVTLGTGGSTAAFSEADLNVASPVAAGNKRLVNKYDFNIEIMTSELESGENTVEIKATDGMTLTKTVTVNYTPDKTWPLPNTLDWNDYEDLQQVLAAGEAQVVDGAWYLYDDGDTKWLRIQEDAIGYDRNVAIGDVKWKDIDVLVPVQIEDFPHSSMGNAGLMVRWQGHIEAASGEQPLTGWWESGVYGKYRNRASSADCGSRLEMIYTHDLKVVDEDCEFQLKTSQPYYFRFRVNTTETAPYGFYSMKVWDASQEEPVDWNFAVEDELPDALETGSIMLSAHEADVMFGKVEVTPLVDLQVTIDGPGTVEISPTLTIPSDAYLLGDSVQLTAIPDDPATHGFAGWTGDLTGSENPASLTLDKPLVQVKASFLPCYTLTTTVTPTATGTIAADPLPNCGTDRYTADTEVQLTASPSAGFYFHNWTGDATGDTNPIKVVVDGDKTVTAVFGDRPPVLYLYLPLAARAAP